MRHIIVRHRTSLEGADPAFSDRSYRALSGAGLLAAEPPPQFADSVVPLFGETLAESVYLSGLFAPPALCSGIGRCGLCRLRYLGDPPPPLDAEKAVLSEHDLDAGWRLGCRRDPLPGAHVLVPALPANAAAAAMRSRESWPPAPDGGPFGLAVDLGTTSIHWRFVSLGGDSQTPLPHGIMTNPQMGAGSDVISRLARASSPDGAAALRRLVIDALSRVIAHAGENGYATEELCVAGNPAMNAILLGLETGSLARAPYGLPDPGGRVAVVPDLPPLYLPPHISPFVGADISAGYAALALDPDGAKPEYPFLLADLGTNGECVLALSEERALTASLPMGPALEGVNLAFGCEAVPGAITDYALTPSGLAPSVLGGGAPVGVSATGYLSLLRSLRAAGLLAEDGRFSPPENPLSRRLGGAVHTGGEPSLRLPGRMILFASDVEEILKVKAAFSLAVSRLLREAALPAAGVRRVFLAGSLGSHAPVAALTDLGFLPAVLGPRTAFAGNTSLAGAALFLLHKKTRARCEAWARKVLPLDLAGDPSFAAEYARHMAFAWRA
ncbi:MAG: ASKHA domain-containing protein [Deltaproteobacteria bacterium]|jgi:uncharacterized 2Fe-2S/4Fe-4S cluster protein (DUF4445 family)|nr:ASKHA domain-containing protein [Deltaproteobacteria bacterium]